MVDQVLRKRCLPVLGLPKRTLLSMGVALVGRRAYPRLVPVRAPDLTDRGGDNLVYRREVMELTAVLTPAEEGGYVALNPETGTTTQGETVEEAVANLREATALYLCEFPLK